MDTKTERDTDTSSLATLYSMSRGGVRIFDIKSQHIKRWKAPLEELY